VVPLLVMWIAWIWYLMVISNVRTITLVWETSLLVWNAIRCFVRGFFFANQTCACKVKYGVWNKRYWKGHIAKPLLPDSIGLDKTYICTFCKYLAFCESRCGACMFIIIGHLPSPKYSFLFCTLVCITILMRRVRIERFWKGSTKR